MEQGIRIMIAEDHALFGQGLRRVLGLEPELDVIAEVGDGVSAVNVALELVPDVVLMDINMPGLNGLQATDQIKRSQESIAVVMLTAYDDEEQLFFALRAGASAYFAKDVLPDELIGAIRAASSGLYVLDGRTMTEAEMVRWMVSRFEDLAFFADGPDVTLMPLSSREMEILELIARGASNKQIAHRLGISQQTVKNHMSSILRKLAANDRTQAAVLALRRGWIRLQDIREPLIGSPDEPD